MNTEERRRDPTNPCRAAIGLLVPARNTVAEIDVHQMVPAGVRVYTARVHNEEPDTLPFDADEQNRQKLEGVVEAAERIAETKPDIVAFCCTSRSFIGGTEGDREVTETIRRHVGLPVVTASTAVSAAVNALALKRVALACPYTDVMVERFKRYLAQHGCDVIRSATVAWELRNERPVPHRLAKQLAGEDIDGIILSCTNFRAVTSIESIERKFGLPVVSSNQATAWLCLRAVGIDDVVDGFGTLLRLQSSVSLLLQE